MRPVMFLATIIACAFLTSDGTNSRNRHSIIPQSHGNLPLQAQIRISELMGRKLPAFAVQTGAVRGKYQFSTPQHGLATSFDGNGMEVSSGEATWQLALKSYGNEGHPKDLKLHDLHATSNRVEYNYGRLHEWFVNGPLGLEQGFMIAGPDQGRISSERKQKHPFLNVALSMKGNLTPILDREGRGLTLFDDKGQRVFSYGSLYAYDSTGRDLLACMRLRQGQLILSVDTTGASYPVVIDPLVQLAHLSASDGKTGDYFGSSVAVGDNVVVVGAPLAYVGANQQQGRAYVFSKSPSGWANMTETAELTPSDGESFSYFGVSVAISGRVIVVGANGAPAGGAHPGAAYVFVEPATGWRNTTETAKLSVQDELGGDFGVSVAISGPTIVCGAIEDGSEAGAAYVFVKPTTGWKSTTSATAQLRALDGVPNDFLGQSVAIDGDTIVVGADWATFTQGQGAGRGAAYVFVKPEAGWSSVSQTAKLTGSDTFADDLFGISVSISKDTIVVGEASNTTPGTAYIFVEPSGGWAQLAGGSTTETAKLTAPDGVVRDGFGDSVAVYNRDILVGAPGVNVNSNQEQGAAYFFTKPNSGWATTSHSSGKFVSTGGAALDLFGTSVSTTGRTFVVGARMVGPENSPGAAYVFYNPYEMFTPSTVSFPATLLNTTSNPVTVNFTYAGPGSLTLNGLAAGNSDFTLETDGLTRPCDLSGSISLPQWRCPSVAGLLTQAYLPVDRQ